MNAPNQLTLFDVANHSNLGKDFEDQLESAHEWYRLQGWADVRKIPSNWEFISPDNYRKYQKSMPPSSLAKTDDGRFMRRIKSDVDFVGGGASFSIVFDAKACSSKNLPLSNIASHQLLKMRSRSRCRMIAGAMVYMSVYDRVFFVPYAYLEKRESVLLATSGRRAKPGTASISLAEFEVHGTEIFRHKTNCCWDWLSKLTKY